jgi:hypothetical protein
MTSPRFIPIILQVEETWYNMLYYVDGSVQDWTSVAQKNFSGKVPHWFHSFLAGGNNPPLTYCPYVFSNSLATISNLYMKRLNKLFSPLRDETEETFKHRLQKTFAVFIERTRLMLKEGRLSGIFLEKSLLQMKGQFWSTNEQSFVNRYYTTFADDKGNTLEDCADARTRWERFIIFSYKFFNPGKSEKDFQKNLTEHWTDPFEPRGIAEKKRKVPDDDHPKTQKVDEIQDSEDEAPCSQPEKKTKQEEEPERRIVSSTVTHDRFSKFGCESLGHEPCGKVHPFHITFFM